MSFWSDFKTGMVGYDPIGWIANYRLNKRGFGMKGVTK